MLYPHSQRFEVEVSTVFRVHHLHPSAYSVGKVAVNAHLYPKAPANNTISNTDLTFTQWKNDDGYICLL